jgi:P27 family predicted phage terminase small subunit
MAENIPVRPRRSRSAPVPAPVKAVEVPPAPEHLSDEARDLWERIVGEWELDVGSLPILRGALESWDAYQECRRQVAADGPTFTTENGMIRQHPAAKLALDNFGAFRQAMRQLGLEPGV